MNKHVSGIDANKLDKLAQVAIKVGLNLQPGQDLFLTAPVPALPPHLMGGTSASIVSTPLGLRLVVMPPEVGDGMTLNPASVRHQRRWSGP